MFKLNAPRLHFWFKQCTKSLCYIIYDTQMNMYIQSDSNERYVTVEFKLHKIACFRCSLV